MTLIVPLLCHAQDLSCRGGRPNPDMVGAKKIRRLLLRVISFASYFPVVERIPARPSKGFCMSDLLSALRELAWQRIVVSPAPFGILGTVDLVRNNAQTDGLAVLLTDRRREQTKAVL